jgi:group I intron endonuclease
MSQEGAQGQSATKAAMKNLIIYSITNTQNGKVYVGQTMQGLARRKGEHVYRFNLGERDHKLYQAMRKHGIEAFRFDVLVHCLKAEYLDEMEKFFVEQFNSFHRGYNMTCGGDSISEETRKKIGAANKGRKILWYDKIVAYRKLNPNRKKASEFVARGAENVNAKRYKARLPSGDVVEFAGLRQFCKEHGLTHSLLLATIKGLQNHHKGYSLLARLND